MNVEVWSDIVCPWCYIGKRRLEAAVARFSHRDEVELVWRSFELDPAAPSSPSHPGEYVEHLADKYGIATDRAQRMVDRVVEVGAEEGLHFRFDIARRGNTFDAHRLLHLARERGLQDPLKEQLDHETFTAGLPVSDHEALAGVATGVGLDPIEVKEVLSFDRYAEAVRSDEARARAYGISAVPFFVTDGQYGVAGAQPPEMLLQILTEAWQARFANRSAC